MKPTPTPVVEEWEEIEEPVTKKKVKKKKVRADGAVWVEAHTRSNGQRVEGHWRARPGQGR